MSILDRKLTMSFQVTPLQGWLQHVTLDILKEQSQVYNEESHQRNP